MTGAARSLPPSATEKRLLLELIDARIAEDLREIAAGGPQLKGEASWRRGHRAALQAMRIAVERILTGEEAGESGIADLDAARKALTRAGRLL